MFEEKTISIASKVDGLLQQELHLIRTYRLVLSQFPDSLFQSLLATMLEGHERCVRDLRGHGSDSPRPFVDRPALPFNPESGLDFDPGKAIDYLADEERKSIRESEGILGDERSPASLRSLIRGSVVPRLENHVAVLAIMESQVQSEWSS